jgi:hypothetical protein
MNRKIANAAWLLLTAILLSACASNSEQAEQVVFAPIGDHGTAVGTDMTRAELEDHVRRFADRYFTRIALATNQLRDKTDSEEQRRLMHDWKTISNAAIVGIAIGPNAVTNLLDMMVLTRLSRLVVDSYWIPEVLGPELGTDFREPFTDLEEDIWTIADDVLTEHQQNELRFLVDQWHAENPGQYYPWYVRLSNFSGQRAASLAAVQKSGGMLVEVARAREAAEEIQAFGERMLFYMQRAPMLTTSEFESSIASILGGPEISSLVNNTDRFVLALERFIEVVDDLPGDRLEVVDQLMDRVADERRLMFEGMADAEPNMRALLSELLPVMESIERSLVVAKTKSPDAKPFDINQYTEIVSEAAVTAAELRLLIRSVSDLLEGASDASPLVGAIVEAERQIADRLFWQMVTLIFIFFFALIGYRLVAARLFRNH